MRKRGKRFSGTPSDHAQSVEHAAGTTEYHAHQAEAALEEGDCKGALDDMLRSNGAMSVALIHVAESRSTGNNNRKGDLLVGAEQALNHAVGLFKQECVRKPGLLDRLRKRRI